MIDWTQCEDVESVEGRCGGQPVVKGTRIPVDAILTNAEDCSPEEIAGPDIYPDISVEVVKRILAFAGVTALDYSDIPPLDDEFFSTAKRPGKP